MTLFRGTGLGRQSREPKDPNRFPKVPSPEGRKLMQSGVFGSNDNDLRPKKQIARRILEREIGLGDRMQRKRDNGVLAQVSMQGLVLLAKLEAVYLCRSLCVMLMLTYYFSGDRASSLEVRRKRLSTTTTQSILANSQTMETSSSPVVKTSTYACTTLPTPTTGSFIRRPTFLLASGP
jgi:hypothetical protein